MNKLKHINMDLEFWYKHLKEHHPYTLGSIVIDYVESLKKENKELKNQLNNN